MKIPQALSLCVRFFYVCIMSSLNKSPTMWIDRPLVGPCQGTMNRLQGLRCDPAELPAVEVQHLPRKSKKKTCCETTKSIIRDVLICFASFNIYI